MNFEELRVVLSRLGVEAQAPPSEHQVQISCPLAPFLHKNQTDKHPSCSVRFGDPAQPTLFKCFGCGEQGKLWYLVDTLGRLGNDPELVKYGLHLLEKDEPSLSGILDAATSGFDSWVHDAAKQQHALDWQIFDNFKPAWTVSHVRRYLEARGVTEVQSYFWKLLASPKQDRVIFPVLDREKQLWGAVGRAVSEEIQPKYWNYFGFDSGQHLGGWDLFQGRNTVIVCEGVFDLIRVYRWAHAAGCDVVCTFGASTSRMQAAELAAMDVRLLYMYDQDEAGERGWEKAKKLFADTAYGLKRCRWADKTLDLGGMHRVEFENALYGARVSQAKQGET
jgi:hypothetical protein